MAVFADQLELMIDDGASIVAGTVDALGTPRVTRAWAATVVDPEAGRIRVAIGADDPVVVANLDGGLVAITAADVRTFHSIQLKGRVGLVAAPTAEDLATVQAQTDALLTAIHETDGNSYEMLRRFLPHEIVMVELDVSDSFDQTPGPDAGAPIGVR